MSAETRFVLDSSVALAWCFIDETSAYADAVAASLAGAEAIVPSLWPLEIGNALLMGERRGRSAQADTARWTGFLESLPIVIDDETTVRAWSETLNLARARGLSVYDASYLELAIRRGLPLATLDGKLMAAATAVGLAPYQPPPP